MFFHIVDVPGVSTPRELSLFGFPLTSTRKISTTVHEHGPKKEPKNKYNHMLMQWGQFVDHDITSTPFEKGRFCILGYPQ